MLSAVLASLAFCRASSPEGLGTVIGIDLGTTYSCVAYFHDGRVDVIPNEAGGRITPSVVSFDKFDCLVGGAAKHRLASNPKNTIFAVKRLMGLRFSDPKLQSELKRLPYTVVNVDDHPFIEVDFEEKRQRFAPEAISAMILKKMKEIAEAYIGQPVRNAVITVPAYFNDAQRKATIAAGTIAGLNVVRILNEPTAAALAFGLHTSGDRHVLVFDLGGGTFDVSVLRLQTGVFDVLATNGDTHLGGEDFDHRLVAYLAEVYRQNTGNSCRESETAMAKLKAAAQSAKHTLSSEFEAQIFIESLHDGNDFAEVVKRVKFQELNEDLFQRTISCVGQVLQDAGLRPQDIDEILLVGGSTRIPRIQQLVKKNFKGKEPSKNISPDEAVGYGAAVQAAIVSADEKLGGVLLLNVNPLSLGVALYGDVMEVMIPRNTRVPARKTRNFTTVSDGQDAALIQIFEGESPRATDNHFLGEFNLTGIQVAVRGLPVIEVTFELNTNGILVVRAMDKTTKAREEIQINSQNRLTHQQEQEAMARIASMGRPDQKGGTPCELLESLVEELTMRLENTGKAVDKDVGRLKKELAQTEKWLAQKQRVTSKVCTEKIAALRAVSSFVASPGFQDDNSL
jgi:heat shock protein 5